MLIDQVCISICTDLFNFSQKDQCFNMTDYRVSENIKPNTAPSSCFSYITPNCSFSVCVHNFIFLQTIFMVFHTTSLLLQQMSLSKYIKLDSQSSINVLLFPCCQSGTGKKWTLPSVTVTFLSYLPDPIISLWYHLKAICTKRRMFA